MNSNNKSPITQLIELYVDKSESAYNKHLETMHTDIKTSEKYYDRCHIIGNLKQQLVDEFLIIEKNYILELIDEIKNHLINNEKELIGDNDYFNNDFWKTK
jgi:hypothetical protein